MLRVMNRTAFVVARVRTFATTAAAAEPPTPAAETARRVRLQLKALGKPQVTPPKRPLSAYALFLQQERQGHAGLTKGSAAEHFKEIAKKWHDLSDAEKAVFKQKAETAKQHYARAYATYLSQRTSTDVLIEKKTAQLKNLINPTKTRKNVAPDPNRPKRPMSGYSLFLKETFAAPPAEQKRVVGESLEGFTVQERMRKIAKAWGRMSKEDQEPYLSGTQKAFAAYKAQRAAYDAENGVTDARQEMDKVLMRAARKTKKNTKAVKKVVKKKGVKKTAAKKTGAKKTGAKKTGAKKTGAQKTAAKKTAAKAA
ncbi:exp1-like protein [Borealophlyctis nickersoniae]|nr:exp1-like protein [Borealophlyctis nickersoniae]